MDTVATTVAASKSQISDIMIEPTPKNYVRMEDNLSSKPLGKCKVTAQVASRKAEYGCLVLDSHAFHVIFRNGLYQKA